VTFNHRLYEISFRWHATAGKCRGESSPRNIVGMWVDKKLVAHYEAWNLTPYVDSKRMDDEDDGTVPESYRNYNSEYTRQEDVFGRGFCQWIQREFQKELASSDPNAVWYALNPDPLDCYSISPPFVTHTVWIDGSVYAYLHPDYDLQRVAEWAGECLGLRIERRDFRPVAKPAKA
jgi:hypothetical protein